MKRWQGLVWVGIVALAVLPLSVAGCGDDGGGGQEDATLEDGTADVQDDAGPDTAADTESDTESDTGADAEPDTANDELVKVTILHTSDLHHWAMGYGPQAAYTPLDTADQDPVTGGYARLAKKIKEIRAEQEAAGVPVLVLDSGDFLMGTVFDLTAADPMALRFFQYAGYDATTFGNHEFDWTPAALADIINAGRAADPAFAVPIVATNALFSADDAGDDGLEQLKADGAIVDKLVFTLDNGLKVGLLGQAGVSADSDAPTAPPVTFDHTPAFLQAAVDGLRNDDGADMVVLLSHGGVESDDTGEDVTLAGKVSGLDVIASGHTHTATDHAIEVGDTLVFEPGSYGRWLSRLDITFNKTRGKIASYDYTLIPIDDAIGGDAGMDAVVAAALQGIDSSLEPALGLQALSPVVETSFPLEREELTETGIGDLCADAFRAAATTAVQGSVDPTPFTMGVVPSGIIRNNIHPTADGLVSFADVYSIFPLGMSLDPANQELPGWPLVSVYATAAELQQICLIPAKIAAIFGPDVYLNFSGVRCGYDPAGPQDIGVINAVYQCGSTLPADAGGEGDVFSTGCGTQLDLSDETTLYRVVTDLYTLLLMDKVTVVLDIHPKHADGTVVDLTDPADFLTTRVDADADADGVQEVKAWAALLGFLEQLPDAGGDPNLPDIPEAVYGPGGTALGRLVPQGSAQ